MKDLTTEPVSASYYLEGEHTPTHNISRRRIVQGLALATIAAVAKPNIVLSANPIAAFPIQNYGPDAWKQLIIALVNMVCEEQEAATISRTVYSATTYYTQGGASFHDRFSPNYILSSRVSPARTTTGRFFEIDRFPFYDSLNPCRRIKDLNAIEIWRFTLPGERRFYGSVVSPCSERRLANSSELEDFRRTARYYNTDPDEWNHAYTRNVSNGRGSYLAHAVSSRVRTNERGTADKNLLVSPYDLFN